MNVMRGLLFCQSNARTRNRERIIIVQVKCMRTALFLAICGDFIEFCKLESMTYDVLEIGVDRFFRFSAEYVGDKYVLNLRLNFSIKKNETS